jgi:membrane-anchored protein YejM (alkaline phosphatase superfamily)
MQLSAPEVAGHTSSLRHATQQATFSRLCLRARRLLERGVRFVTVFSGGSNNKQPSKWDAHSKIETNHQHNAMMVDQPIAALLADLNSRGMLDDKLVIWTGEFGRTPTS